MKEEAIYALETVRDDLLAAQRARRAGAGGRVAAQREQAATE